MASRRGTHNFGLCVGVCVVFKGQIAIDFCRTESIPGLIPFQYLQLTREGRFNTLSISSSGLPHLPSLAVSRARRLFTFGSRLTVIAAIHFSLPTFRIPESRLRVCV